MIGKECKYGDPMCPCQDGKECDYEGPNALFVPPAYVRQILERHKDEVNRNASSHFKYLADERKDWHHQRTAFLTKLRLVRNYAIQNDLDDLIEILDA